MALLRNCVRLWTRPARSLCSNARFAADSPIGDRIGDRDLRRSEWHRIDVTLNDRLSSNENINREDWTAIRKELLERTDLKFSNSTVDMAIVGICADHHHPEKAMEYLEYLWNGTGEVNVSSMTAYFRLCYSQRPSETQKLYILGMYDRLRKKYPVMDALTAESCIMGLSWTERWRESSELLEMIKLSCQPRSFPYAAMINAAFRNDEPEIGWKLLRECLVRLNPTHEIYKTYLEYCTRNFEGAELEAEIGKMFRLWGELDLRPYVDILAEYQKALETRGWSTSQTTIKHDGSCCNCAHKLSALKVSPEKRKKLTEAVRERMIIGSDVYRKSTPAELQKFLNFIDKSRPYDIVVDGLNVSYIVVKSRNHRPDGSQVMNVVKKCVETGKRVFVLGRKHMARWPNFDLNYIKQNGTYFLAENSSADDPYLLYASLIKGPNTMFVSRDLMRQHKFLIEDFELSTIFKYWQMAHQIYPEAYTTKRETVVQLRMPPSYLPVAQADDDGWHVPYTEDPRPQPPLIYEPPSTWVCFRKRPPVSKNPRKSS